MKVNVKVNKGKDFNMNKVEINTLADPGTYIAFSAMDYDLYRRCGDGDPNINVFFTQYAVSFIIIRAF